MKKVPGEIKISYLLAEIFERPLNIPKHPSIENIGTLYNHGPGVRGTNTKRLPSPIWEHTHLCQDFLLFIGAIWNLVKWHSQIYFCPLLNWSLFLSCQCVVLKLFEITWPSRYPLCSMVFSSYLAFFFHFCLLSISNFSTKLISVWLKVNIVALIQLNITLVFTTPKKKIFFQRVRTHMWDWRRNRFRRSKF